MSKSNIHYATFGNKMLIKHLQKLQLKIPFLLNLSSEVMGKCLTSVKPFHVHRTNRKE